MSKMITRTVTVTTALATIIREDGTQSMEVVQYLGKASIKEALKHAKAGKVLGKNDQVVIANLREENNKYGMSIHEFMEHATFLSDFAESDDDESKSEDVESEEE